MTKTKYIKLRRIQLVMGLVFLAISAIIIFAAASEPNRDGTAVLFTLPFGLYLMFTKRIVIYH